jgi:F0F1-type ATP synthase assembly protein I
MTQRKSSSFLKTHRSVVSSTKGMSTGMLLGSSFAVATGGLGWLGHLADLKHGTEPWLAVGGVFLGLGYGAYEVWKLTRSSSDTAGRVDTVSATEDPAASPEDHPCDSPHA